MNKRKREDLKEKIEELKSKINDKKRKIDDLQGELSDLKQEKKQIIDKLFLKENEQKEGIENEEEVLKYYDELIKNNNEIELNSDYYYVSQNIDNVFKENELELIIKKDENNNNYTIKDSDDQEYVLFKCKSLSLTFQLWFDVSEYEKFSSEIEYDSHSHPNKNIPKLSSWNFQFDKEMKYRFSNFMDNIDSKTLDKIRAECDIMSFERSNERYAYHDFKYEQVYLLLRIK